MFGMAVEHDIDKATEKAKTTKDAQRKAKTTLEKWLRDPDIKGPKFRDPAQK